MELTVANTAIVIDSTADFPDAPARFPNWRVVPLYVRFGEESYRDHVELSAAEFYARLRGSALTPATSQPTPADFLEVYRELAGYARVLSLHIAGGLSGTVESAERAAAELGGGRVRTFDSERASAAVAMLGLAIQRRLERGTTDEAVEALVERFRREAGLLFTVDTFEYLVRGGRVGRARALAGELLQVKPILAITGGEVLPVKRVRGSQKAITELVRGLTTAVPSGRGLRIAIGHADAPERAAQLRRAVLEAFPDAVLELETMLGPVIGAHAGPGAVGLFWFPDPL